MDNLTYLANVQAEMYRLLTAVGGFGPHPDTNDDQMLRFTRCSLVVSDGAQPSIEVEFYSGSLQRLVVFSFDDVVEGSIPAFIADNIVDELLRFINVVPGLPLSSPSVGCRLRVDIGSGNALPEEHH